MAEETNTNFLPFRVGDVVQKGVENNVRGIFIWPDIATVIKKSGTFSDHKSTLTTDLRVRLIASSIRHLTASKTTDDPLSGRFCLSEGSSAS